MVFTEDQIKGIVKKTIEKLKSDIAIDAVYLFGSYSDGRATTYSDIDLAFISDDFAKMGDYQRSKCLMKVLDRIDLPEPKDIEPVGLTWKEYKNPDKFSLASQVKKTGKVIYKN
ncbi:MAG: nucleotidyltransferase domain-containing protein [Deltaproteobacteria bacterium]|nr:nucleotidyltransferase domain-containing protein [Deltaproteobacteria bacterium]